MESTTLVAIVTAIISGGIGGFATMLAYAHGYLRIERLEARRRRITVAYEVLAYRYALKPNGNEPNGNGDEISRHRFNKALNEISVVFGGDRDVIEIFDAFIINKSDDNLKNLLLILDRRTGLKGNLLDTHLMRTMTV